MSLNGVIFIVKDDRWVDFWGLRAIALLEVAISTYPRRFQDLSRENVIQSKLQIWKGWGVNLLTGMILLSRVFISNELTNGEGGLFRFADEGDAP
jgi:hypothetical protein